jgi:chromosome segregation ATPase
METLKRKLSSTRRPETANRNLLPELSQFRQNNVALQKQIELLMAKLNESKQSERAMRRSLDEAIQQCNEWQEKAEEASKARKSAQALQNTIDHLENRLEISNIEKLDAEEQLFLIQAQKSPFDFHLGLQVHPAVKHSPVKVS